jgi:hypothetical protein
MASSRIALFLLTCSTVLLLSASIEDVDASQCLPSAASVRQQHPGAWPSWTIRMPGHTGAKCWYSATREARGRRYDAGLHAAAMERRRSASAASDEEPDNGALASTLETNALGWSFRTVTTQIGTAMSGDDGELADRSFDARFDAAYAQSSLSRPSIIQRMMDPGGSLP